jgi:hypothetical protein
MTHTLELLHFEPSPPNRNAPTPKAKGHSHHKHTGQRGLSRAKRIWCKAPHSWVEVEVARRGNPRCHLPGMVDIEELHSRPGRLSRVPLVSMHAIAILEKYIEDFGKWYKYVLFDVGYPGSGSGGIVASKVFSR